jgi:uncharacterized protein (TIRG00374 family)
MSFRSWLSVLTLVLIAVIIYFSRHELLRAWELLGSVNVWILALLIPGQLLVYYAGAEIMFSYLRAKKSIEDVSGPELTRMSLEMNFVNHILPSGGVSGISYMTWRLGKHGVTHGRAAMAQVVRFAMSFVGFMLLLVVAVLIVTIDGQINRWIILVSAGLVVLMLGSIVGGIYLIGGQKRMERAADWIVRHVNPFMRWVTFGRRKRFLGRAKVETFFREMHDDYLALRQDKRVLVKPLIWSIVFTLADAGLFIITFWALGEPVNPAPVLIAYGVAAVAGFFVVTPGGAGAYEAIMVAFLAVAGLSQGIAIAGIVLTRVILLLGTIILGYVFYQMALVRYGKRDK